jgi:DNA-binding HxlR family transcriptional regulator
MAKRLAKNFNCPTEFTLQVLGGKWKTVILCFLSLGPLRYAELRKFMPNLSDKVLSQRLHELAEAGLIEHRKSASGDNKPEIYALAARAKSLECVLTQLYSWGETNAAEFGVTVGHPRRSTDGLAGSRT